MSTPTQFPLINPAPGRPVTSPYGERRFNQLTGKWETHNGIDAGGTFPVLAAGDGHVHQNQWSNTFGWFLVIQHTRTLRTRYCHGRERSPLFPRAQVRARDDLFTSGSTGMSTAPHLHWEVWLWTPLKGWHRVDPNPYLATAPTDREDEDDDMRATTVHYTGKSEQWAAVWPGFQDGVLLTRSASRAKAIADIHGRGKWDIVTNNAAHFNEILGEARRGHDEYVATLREAAVVSGSTNLQPVLDAIGRVPTAEQNGQAAREAIVK